MRTGRLLGLLLAAACLRAPAPEPERFSPEHFYPLAVGNTWTYAGSFLGQAVEKPVSIVAKVGEFFQDSTGARLRADGLGVRDPHRYLLQRPLRPGTNWKSVVGVGSVEHYEIVGVDQKVATSAGTFEGCVTVRSSNRQSARTELYNEITFAPGVGVVRIHTYALTDGKRIPQVSFELKSYRLGAGSAGDGGGGR